MEDLRSKLEQLSTDGSQTSELTVFVSSGHYGQSFNGVLASHIPAGHNTEQIQRLVKVKPAGAIGSLGLRDPETVEAEVRYKSGKIVKLAIIDSPDDESCRSALVVGDSKDGLSTTAYKESEFDLPECDIPVAAMAVMYSFCNAPGLPGKLLTDISTTS